MFKKTIAGLFLVLISLNSFPQENETVTIGKQTWMKYNLNIDVLGSICYAEDSVNCEKYGRLYFWQAALDACPAGFRLPTDKDWTILTDYVGGIDTAGTMLKKGSELGFDVVFAGNYHPDLKMFSYGNEVAYYWTATAHSFHTAWIRSFKKGQKNINRTTIGKSFYFSIRCIKID